MVQVIIKKKSIQEAVQTPSSKTKVLEADMYKRTSNTAAKSPAADVKTNAPTKQGIEGIQHTRCLFRPV